MDGPEGAGVRRRSHRDEDPTTTRLAHVVVDAQDPGALARFWAVALGWRVVVDGPEEVEIEGGRDDVNLIFVPVPDAKTGKSRVHLDLATSADDDHSAKVERLLEGGASRVDIGQADVQWIVLADPRATSSVS
ncbi:MAG: VOC family protein [Acidimicrobiia bacterium]